MREASGRYEVQVWARWLWVFGPCWRNAWVQPTGEFAAVSWFMFHPEYGAMSEACEAADAALRWWLAERVGPVVVSERTLGDVVAREG